MRAHRRFSDVATVRSLAMAHHWVPDPARQHARVYRADGTALIVGPDEELDGEQVLRGFRCPLGEIR